MIRRFAACAIKAAVSLALLIYLFRASDLGAVMEVFSLALLGPLLGALVVMLVGLVLSAYKWQALLSADGMHFSVWELSRYYLVGVYFNNFLPTSIGGDATRAYLVTKRYGKTMESITAVFVERFSGLLALVLYGLFASILGQLELRAEVCARLTLIFGACLLALLLGLNRRVTSLAVGFFPSSIGEKIRLFLSGIGHYLAVARTSRVLLWTSIVYPLLAILVYYLAAQSLGLTLSFLSLAISVPLVTVLTMVPFSLNGLGIREGGFVFFLSFFQVSKAEALSLSLLVYLLTLGLSVVGGILFTFDKVKREA